MLAGRTAHDGEAGRGVPTFAVSSLDGARPLWIRIYEQSRAGELTDIKSARKRGCGRRRRPACRVSRRADRADRACVRRAAAAAGRAKRREGRVADAGFVARDALTYVNRRPAPAPNLIAR